MLQKATDSDKVLCIKALIIKENRESIYALINLVVEICFKGPDQSIYLKELRHGSAS